MPPTSLVDLVWDIPKEVTPRSTQNPIFSVVPEAQRLPVVLNLDELGIILGSISTADHLSSARITDRTYLRMCRSSTTLTSSFVSRAVRFASSAASSQISMASGFASIHVNNLPKTAAAVTGPATSNAFMEFVNIDDVNSGRETRTTYMIRRLPRYMSVDQLVKLMVNAGLGESYDLIYVPVFTGKAHANRGYSFINFRTAQAGALFLSILRYSTDTELSRQLGRCDVVYAHIQSKDDMVCNLTRVRADINSGSNKIEYPTLPPGLLLL